ncbi:hypothetical protein SMNI109538_08055 [Smaragdicoccus niigatensis]
MFFATMRRGMAIEENVSEWRFGWVIRILVPVLGFCE